MLDDQGAFPLHALLPPMIAAPQCPANFSKLDEATGSMPQVTAAPMQHEGATAMISAGPSLYCLFLIVCSECSRHLCRSHERTEACAVRFAFPGSRSNHFTFGHFFNDLQSLLTSWLREQGSVREY
jgi:hypothetical protein